jgi:hypothetical protein
MAVSTVYRILLKLFFSIGVKSESILNKRTVIVGTSDESLQIASKLKNKKTDVHSFIGLIGKSNSDIGKILNGYKVIGSVQNFKKVLAEAKINEVIFPSKAITYSEIMDLLSASRSNSVDYKIAGTELDFIVGKTSVSMLDDIPLVDVHYNISSPSIKIVKSIFDYMLAFAVLFFLYPFIYFFSKLKHNKSDFQKIILNVPSVISGKFSFVGPKSSNKEKKRYYGKPGLTGLWYVENCDESEIEKFDFYYAKNQNIWLDLDILGRTLNKIWERK